METAVLAGARSPISTPPHDQMLAEQLEGARLLRQLLRAAGDVPEALQAQTESLIGSIVRSQLSLMRQAKRAFGWSGQSISRTSFSS
jgi:hypothetical protein